MLSGIRMIPVRTWQTRGMWRLRPARTSRECWGSATRGPDPITADVAGEDSVEADVMRGPWGGSAARMLRLSVAHGPNTEQRGASERRAACKAAPAVLEPSWGAQVEWDEPRRVAVMVKGVPVVVLLQCKTQLMCAHRCGKPCCSSAGQQGAHHLPVRRPGGRGGQPCSKGRAGLHAGRCGRHGSARTVRRGCAVRGCAPQRSAGCPAAAYSA